MSPPRPSVASPRSAATSPRPSAAAVASLRPPHRANPSLRSTTTTLADRSDKMRRNFAPLPVHPRTRPRSHPGLMPASPAHPLNRATWRSAPGADHETTSTHAPPPGQPQQPPPRPPRSCPAPAGEQAPVSGPPPTTGMPPADAHHPRAPAQPTSHAHRNARPITFTHQTPNSSDPDNGQACDILHWAEVVILGHDR